ncbi:hypothetical protein D9M68_691490 [compost metagenome]
MKKRTRCGLLRPTASSWTGSRASSPGASPHWPASTGKRRSVSSSCSIPRPPAVPPPICRRRNRPSGRARTRRAAPWACRAWTATQPRVRGWAATRAASRWAGKRPTPWLASPASRAMASIPPPPPTAWASRRTAIRPPRRSPPAHVRRCPAWARAASIPGRTVARWVAMAATTPTTWAISTWSTWTPPKPAPAPTACSRSTSRISPTSRSNQWAAPTACRATSPVTRSMSARA